MQYKPYNQEVNDQELARYFMEYHGKNVRWNVSKGQWLHFDGKHWNAEKGETSVKSLVLETLDFAGSSIFLNARKKKIVYDDGNGNRTQRQDHSDVNAAKRNSNKLRMNERANSVMEVLKTFLPVYTGQLNANPYLFNCVNGVLDTSTRKLIPHEETREMLITQISNLEYDPAKKEMPKWREHLEFMFQDEVCDYIQRFCGYLLTGSTGEQCLTIFYGTGNNGKSVFNGVLVKMFGTVDRDGYYVSLPFAALTESRSSLTPYNGKLAGARVAGITEVSRKPWDAEMVKSATGSDPMKANEKYQKPYEFMPTHKFLILANHKPVVRDFTKGFWRKIHLVILDREIPAEKDRPLEVVVNEMFEEEGSAILNWMLDGEMKRRKHRLSKNLPKAILEAIKEYRNEEDVFMNCLSRHYVLDPLCNVDAPALVEKIRNEYKKDGHFPISAKTITANLRENGVTRGGSGNMFYYGLRELSQDEKDKAGFPTDNRKVEDEHPELDLDAARQIVVAVRAK